MAFSMAVAPIIPATPQVSGVDHLKPFRLSVTYSGLVDSTNQVVLGKAGSVPAEYGDFDQSQHFHLWDADVQTQRRTVDQSTSAGSVIFFLDGSDWSAGDNLYVAFVATEGVPGPTEPLVAVKGPIVVT